jgi:hypothetical protein
MKLSTPRVKVGAVIEEGDGQELCVTAQLYLGKISTLYTRARRTRLGRGHGLRCHHICMPDDRSRHNRDGGMGATVIRPPSLAGRELALTFLSLRTSTVLKEDPRTERWYLRPRPSELGGFARARALCSRQMGEPRWESFCRLPEVHSQQISIVIGGGSWEKARTGRRQGKSAGVAARSAWCLARPSTLPLIDSPRSLSRCADSTRSPGGRPFWANGCGARSTGHRGVRARVERLAVMVVRFGDPGVSLEKPSRKTLALPLHDGTVRPSCAH